MPKKSIKQNKAANPEDWVDLYGNYLYRFALGRLRNPDLAENAVQETFLAALKAKKSFQGRSTEKTWLIGILKHKIIDHFRKSYKEITVTDLKTDDRQTIDSFYDEIGHPRKYPFNWLPDSKELAANGEFWEVLEECLKRLPKITADAFTLREMDRMDTKDICKLLRITSTNLWVMLHRARLQLRGCLETNWFEQKQGK